MLRDYAKERDNRISFIRATLKEAGLNTIVFGSSGGKDSVLAGILCKMAVDKTIGIIMPSESRRNYTEDRDDALLLGQTFSIEHIEIDITNAKKALQGDIEKAMGGITHMAGINISPRLRMTALYAAAANLGALVCGTSNRSEAHMGYYTKWGDGSADFNPIHDLTATEIIEFLEFLNAPKRFLDKAPSAGLYDGQTDEKDMGITYKEIDEFLLSGKQGENFDKIEKAHKISEHKRSGVKKY